MKWFRIGLAAPLIVLIAGCAQNAVRLESAGRVSTAATVVVDQANAALTSARQNRLLANASLIASDRSCSPASDTIDIYVPNTQFTASTPPAPLCAVPRAGGGYEPKPGYDIKPISLKPIPEEALKPTIALIGAVADYQGALAKIVGRPDTDVQKELEAVMAKASIAKSLAEGLTGTTLPGLPDLKSKQAESAIKLIAFVTKLAEEARKVKDVRRLVVARSDQVIAIIPDLKAQLTLWNQIVQGIDLTTRTNSLLRAYEVQKNFPTSTFEERYGLVQTINGALADEGAADKRQVALNKALDTFVEANTELRNALNGQYTPEMRRRIAALNEERILAGLKLVAEAVVAFGGL